MLSVSLIHDIISVRFAWVGTGYRRSQARVGHYFKWVGHSPEWVGHGLPGLGLEPPLGLVQKLNTNIHFISQFSPNFGVILVKFKVYCKLLKLGLLVACPLAVSYVSINDVALTS